MSRPKRDPLIQAMIAKLPADGEEWPVERQMAWLKLMAMAFQAAYGGNVAAEFDATPVHKTEIGAGSPPPKLQLLEQSHAFYIDASGFVRKRGGQLINPSDVTGEVFDTRGQDGDLKTIQWANGSQGLQGADLTIIAA